MVCRQFCQLPHFPCGSFHMHQLIKMFNVASSFSFDCENFIFDYMASFGYNDSLFMEQYFSLLCDFFIGYRFFFFSVTGFVVQVSLWYIELMYWLYFFQWNSSVCGMRIVKKKMKNLLYCILRVIFFYLLLFAILSIEKE